ncbi:TonB-dependent receptor domain-containing protein [Sphingorhabdus contaminans]|uniref:TonB-dependent receptor domain-containing protein n=1 Tax=Sphingorhabdus contaminans TaxID=1343899 RepID=UPI003D2E69FC
MKFTKSISLLAATCLTFPAFAQEAPPTAAPEAEESAPIIVTGSRIKRDPTDSSLPLQVINTEELSREGINSPEQLISYLSTNGNGADNLASNADVTSGAQRGTNGLSAANLRGQGSASTLVLLNGRRVAAHGLTGSAVDVNQIPIAALERVEVLKDGASAIYGTDAIGGVINFITKTNFQGLTLNAFNDITEAGGGNIYRLSATAGYGDLDEQGFNIMGAVSRSVNNVLNGSDRSFVNGNQPNRGLSVDTRGTPIATAFPTGANAIFAPTGSLLSGVTLLEAGATVPATGGINILDLPGGAGCGSVDGGMAYDEQLWAIPSARFACAWDTGRAAVLQQPLNTLTYYGRATVKAGDHQFYAEITGSDADSAKRFSNNQYSGNATTLPLYYPLNPTTAATYNDVYNRLVAVFPQIAVNYGKPISYRWRCVACGTREYETNTKTLRAALGAEGPLFGDWDYRAGASYARSESSSVLGDGYHYRGTFSSAAAAAASGVPGAVSGGIDPRAPTAPGATRPGIVGLLNSGILNPFSVTQSPEALAGLRAISAKGVTLYGGKYEVKQLDASISGSLFDLPGGAVQVALGVDYRRETYSFNGSPAAVTGTPDIFNVAFDNINALTPKNRDVKAAYAEVLFPIFDMLEVTGAVRLDDYTGFGTTINPKVSAKFRPVDWFMVRGSYNTGFRVPAFNQIFNGVTQSPNPGNTLVDPTTCPSGTVSLLPGCAAITPDTLTGGNLNLGPETSEQYSVGVVLQPSNRFSASVDFWSIAVDDTIGALTLRQLLDNIAFFPDRVIRTNGIITLIDLRADNIGSRRTEGLEVSLRGGADLAGGVLTAGLDGTYLLKKREKFLPSAPFGPSLIGVFSFSGDLGLKWKHNAFLTYTKDDLTFSISQIYRDGYKNQALPGIANGTVTRPDFNPRVKPYIIYNTSVSLDIQEQFRLTFGIKNLFDKDPPFAITYDSNTGAGSSWEPRVADPRGRSFTLAVEAKF